MSLSDTINRIDALKKELDGLRPIKPEYEQRIRQKFRIDWTFHSNSIEGNSLTYGETKVLILHGLTTGNKPLQDYREIEGHHEVLKEVEALRDKKIILTQKAVREYHFKMLGEKIYTIIAETSGGERTTRVVTPGQYKQQPNHVRTVTGEIFYFEEPGEPTNVAMTALFDWANEETNMPTLHPLIFAATFHYRFIRIHPFDDGNGRIARLLMNVILSIYEYPPVIVRQEHKEQYYRTLRAADGGILDPFVEYIGDELMHSLAIAIRGARGEPIEEE